MRGATAPRLLLELICARVLLPGADDSTDGLLARLDRLERRVSIEGGAPSTAPAPVHHPAAPARQQPSSAPAPVPSTPAPGPATPTPTPAPAAAPAAVPSSSPAPPPTYSTPPAPASTEQSEQPEQPEPSRESAPRSGGLGLVEVRRLWPDLLDAVKLKRRYTWILLSQNAQVAAVDEKTLTIALINAGARNSFVSGGSEEILRQAAIDVIGHDWRVEAIVDPSAQPGTDGDNAPRIVRPAVAPEPAAARDVPQAPDAASEAAPEAASEAAPPPPRVQVDPEAIASARGAIQATRAPGSVQRSGATVSDDDADRDDPDADDGNLAGAELLQRELGARVIEEIKHD